jgi:hypothetical protein
VHLITSLQMTSGDAGRTSTEARIQQETFCLGRSSYLIITDVCLGHARTSVRVWRSEAALARGVVVTSARPPRCINALIDWDLSLVRRASAAWPPPMKSFTTSPGTNSPRTPSGAPSVGNLHRASAEPGGDSNRALRHLRPTYGSLSQS